MRSIALVVTSASLVAYTHARPLGYGRLVNVALKNQNVVPLARRKTAGYERPLAIEEDEDRLSDAQVEKLLASSKDFPRKEKYDEDDSRYEKDEDDSKYEKEEEKDEDNLKYEKEEEKDEDDSKYGKEEEKDEDDSKYGKEEEIDDLKYEKDDDDDDSKYEKPEKDDKASLKDEKDDITEPTEADDVTEPTDQDDDIDTDDEEEETSDDDEENKFTNPIFSEKDDFNSANMYEKKNGMDSSGTVLSSGNTVIRDIFVPGTTSSSSSYSPGSNTEAKSQSTSISPTSVTKATSASKPAAAFSATYTF
ncbi:hypothetical protein DSO57_1036556 [Entomophthora muscae]|uniref:Uncharacterized protein n=1 Tax=Entomophthora muscae TaxID=34485 RepID=A0ACC2U884_9FUNG|nr:hypothetical protein DSO57_1036556 [Entomophthora muscae]